MSTETPRTDAEDERLSKEQPNDDGEAYAQLLSFARNLELENTRLAGEVKRLTRERDAAKQQLAARYRVVQVAIKQAMACAFGS